MREFIKFNQLKSIKFKILLLLFSILFTKAIFIFPFKQVPGILGIVLGIVFCILIYILCMASLLFLSKKQWEYKSTSVKWYMFILYMLPSLAAGIFLLLVVYPGSVPYDSMYVWEMTITREFTDLHPILYVVYVDIINNIVNSPWLVILLQIIYTSIAFAYIGHTLQSFGLKKKWCWLIVLLISLYPVNVTASATMLKDVNYMMSLVILSTATMKIIIDNKISKKNMLIIFAASVIALSSRHNALLSISIYYIVLFFVYKSKKNKTQLKKVLILGISSILFFLGARECITLCIGDNYWHRPNSGDILMMPSAQICYTTVDKWDDLTPEQYEAADKYLQLDFVRNIPYIKENWKFNHMYPHSLDYHGIEDNPFGFLGMYIDYWISYPQPMLLSYQQMTGILWAIPEYGYTLEKNVGILEYPTDIGMQTQSKFPELYDLYNQKPKFMFYWRPALYLMLSLLLLFAAPKRHGINSLLVALPMFANDIGYVIGCPAQNVRYLYCNYSIFFILLIFTLMSKLPHEKSN